MFFKILIIFIYFFNFFFSAHANDKQNIIDRLSKIRNFSFSFEQTSGKKRETGTCLLEFDKKLKCNYNDKLQKEIVINNKTLVILHKKNEKIYFYPISKSPFLNILVKDKLITLIQKSELILNKNIKLVYLDDNQKIITVFFGKKNYELTGWIIEDEFKNQIYFSLKIENINGEVSKDYFKIPLLN